MCPVSRLCFVSCYLDHCPVRQEAFEWIGHVLYIYHTLPLLAGREKLYFVQFLKLWYRCA
jgi:hypothetical protein